MPQVLVVDDSAVDSHLAGRLLEKSTDLKAVHAANGEDALAALSRQVFDLVVTDLQMPGMDGLALVEAIRARHPLVPVILMTAHGSEEIAVHALQRGAASYVPKHTLEHDLASTAETVLVMARARHRHHRLRERLTRLESQFELDNDAALIPALVGELSENLQRMRICEDAELTRVTIALGEALDNAMHHGNLEVSSKLREGDDNAYRELVAARRRQPPYKDRRIHVTARETRAEAVFIIRDEGPGFDVAKLPDPTDPANLEKVSGRGLLLIRTFMDEVRHNPAGNEVTLIKRPCEKAL
jgi:CheY-like chemotaxis protein/anti-sigma regulatory factor (Ser/Thr protein kinase)